MNKQEDGEEENKKKKKHDTKLKRKNPHVNITNHNSVSTFNLTNSKDISKEGETEGCQGVRPAPWQCTLSHAYHVEKA